MKSRVVVRKSFAVESSAVSSKVMIFGHVIGQNGPQNTSYPIY